MLSIQDLRVEFGPRVLFENLSFAVQPKERISFAGHNGAGKSTLMKCIAGVIEPNAGTISHPKHTTVGYLPQEGIHITGITLWDETVSAFEEATGLLKEVDALSAELENHDPAGEKFSELLGEIGELELKLDSFDPNKIKPQVESILTGLGFKRTDFQRDCGEFSGGWQMRIALAKLLLRTPDVLLLDEPTNHLDIQSQAWMENYLTNYAGAIIIISHDIALLDKLTKRTIAFANGKAEEYAGNYTYYVEESKHRKEIQWKQYKAQQREIEKIESFINRFRAQANKAAQVQSRIKQLAKIERVEPPEADDAVMNFRFPEPPGSGQTVSQLEGVDKSYGELRIFENFDLRIERGDRLAIVGPNGAGKSTFCRIITGQEEPDAGEQSFGHKVALSFFSQNHADELDGDKTVLETVEEVCSRETHHLARNILGCFLFRGDDVFKKVGVLSGGERSRVALVRMLVRPANFLILDEPTNHLDFQSQAVLQNALDNYAGTYIIVSHNRSFLDPIVTKTLEIERDSPPQVYQGNLSYYLDKKEADEKAKSLQAAPVRQAQVKSSAQQPKLSAKEQRKRNAEIREHRKKVIGPLEKKAEAAEAEIEKLEAAQATISAHIESLGSDAEELRKATDALTKLTGQLEAKISEWEQTSEDLETAKAKFAGEEG